MLTGAELERAMRAGAAGAAGHEPTSVLSEVMRRIDAAPRRIAPRRRAETAPARLAAAVLLGAAAWAATRIAPAPAPRAAPAPSRIVLSVDASRYERYAARAIAESGVPLPAPVRREMRLLVDDARRAASWLAQRIPGRALALERAEPDDAG